jgi:hypothetical protein
MSVTKEYLQSLHTVYCRQEITRTVAYIKSCAIEAAKSGSTKLIIDNFNHGKYGSGNRGGMVIATNSAGVGKYDGTTCYYHIVLDSIEALRNTFVDCLVDVSDGKLSVDWS